MVTTRAITWMALALVACAWFGRLACVAVPGLGDSANPAAEALYLAELGAQADSRAVSGPPTIATIAGEVHLRATRLLIWIGLGLALCLVGAISRQGRSSAIVVSALLFLIGWINLDAYAHVGLLRGLDLKLRLVGHDTARLLRFVVLDGVLPLIVAFAAVVTVIAALKTPTRG
jgi:hypothetical protein